MADCHPDRTHYGLGLCRTCHNREFRRRRGYGQAYYRAHHKPELNRRSRLRCKYGMSIEEYDALVEQQSGLCAICKREPGGRWHRLAVDHDHQTGIVRGLLCHRCNQMLGQSNDDPEIFETAAAYLRKRTTK